MRATWTSAAFVVGLALALSAPMAAQGPTPAPRKLQLTFSNGNVTLMAQNVTLREILAEWSRQGACQFEGADKLAGGTMPPVEFDSQPEPVVMESLLRTAAGYILAPRRAGAPGASQFETVYILATSHPTTPSSYGSSVTTPVAAPLQTSPDDELPPVSIPAPTGGAAPARPPQSPPTMPGVAVPIPVTPGTRPGGGGGGGGTLPIGRGGGAGPGLLR